MSQVTLTSPFSTIGKGWWSYIYHYSQSHISYTSPSVPAGSPIIIIIIIIIIIVIIIIIIVIVIVIIIIIISLVQLVFK